MANVAPLAPTLTGPDDNGYVVYTAIISFGWQFNDPGDTQAAASLRWKIPAGAWNTLTNVTITAGDQYLMAGSTLPNSTLIEWQVQTKDSAGQWSPWSASRFVNTVAAIPTPTITAPAGGAVIDSTPVTVSWTLPAGYAQEAYVLKVQDTVVGVFFYDYLSEQVESTAQSALVDLPVGSFPADISVAFRYNGYWSSLGAGASRVSVTVAVLLPERPLVVLEQVPGKPEVTVSVTNPAPSDAGHLATATWDLLRDGVPIKAGLPPNSSFIDRLVGAGTVDYTVTARTALGGSAESY